MTDKQLAMHIDRFVKLNPKRSKYPKINNKNLESYLVIQNYFINHKDSIKSSNYDNLYFNQHRGLSGQEWIDIFLSTKNYTKYYKSIRVGYPNCRNKELKQKLLLELFYLAYHDSQETLIELTEQDFSKEQKNKLQKLRTFWHDEEWPNYFFTLQTIAHQQIIEILNWNGPLNFENYSKLLIKKLSEKLTEEIIDEQINTITMINLYRNTLSKAKPGIGEQIKELHTKWNSWNSTVKKVKAWELYTKLINLMFIAGLINKKD